MRKKKRDWWGERDDRVEVGEGGGGGGRIEYLIDREFVARKSYVVCNMNWEEVFGWC